MVFGFKLDVSRLLNRVDKIVLYNRFCFFSNTYVVRLLGLIVFFFWRELLEGLSCMQMLFSG